MENKDNNQGNNNKNKKQNQQMLLIILVVSVVLFVILSYMRTMFSSATNQKITYDEFIEKVENDEVDSVIISSDEITIMPKGQEKAYVPVKYFTIPVYDMSLTDRLLKAGVKFEQKESDSSSMILSFVLSYILPILLFWLIISFFMKRMGGGGTLTRALSNAAVWSTTGAMIHRC